MKGKNACELDSDHEGYAIISLTFVCLRWKSKAT